MQAHREEAVVGPLVEAEAGALSASPPEPDAQALMDVVVHLVEFRVCVPGPEVVAPPAQHEVETDDDLLHVSPRAPSVGQLTYAGPDALHRPRRRPPLHVRQTWVSQDRSLLAKPAPEKLEALHLPPDVHQPRLVRV